MASTATAPNTATVEFVDAIEDLAKDIVNAMFGPFTRKAVRANAEVNAFRIVLNERLATMSPAAAAMVRAEVARRAA